MVKKGFDWWLEWASTIFLILGAAFSSADMFPWNVVCSFLGNLGWMWAGFRMKKPSLWSVSVVLTIIYLSGIIYSKF